jgi:hypothetical protein
MWFIWDLAGLACCVITYFTVLAVTVGFLRIGVWEGLLAGDPWAYLHTAIFQYHVVLIYLSHVKCMTTEPGILEKGYEELDLNKMSPDLINTVLAVKDELRRVTNEPDVEIKEVDIDVSAMRENLEESKQSWFKRLFGETTANKNADIQILKEQRRRFMEANEKKMKMENMVVLLGKIKMDALKNRPESSQSNI